MKNLPITAIIITHRAGQLFQQALQSVNWADEIMVIDNRAFLDPNQLTKNENVTYRTISTPITDFAAVRNQAMAEAKHNWVFFLDSDEKFPVDQLPQIAELTVNNNFSGALCFRSDVFYGKKLSYGEAGHQPIIRFLKKGKAKFVGEVHEIAQVGGEIKHLHLEILHFAHPNISEFVNDVTHYAQLVANNSPSTSLGRILLELIFFPPGKLLFGLLIQGGIADGWRGLIYAGCMALHSLLVRIFRYENMANQVESSSI